MVITAKTPIYSVFFLVLTFLNSAFLLFLLEIEFLSLMFIVVYVGAIAVLFLFVVMMLDIKITSSKKDYLKYFSISFFIGLLFFTQIVLVLTQNFEKNPYCENVLYNFYFNWYQNIDSFSNIESIGQNLYTNYIIQFLIAGLILFLAVIGSVVLTNQNVNNIKQQNINRQIARKFL